MNIVARIAPAAVAAMAISCGGSPGAPAPPLNLSGVWNGTGIDSGGATVVAFTLTQSGASVSGSVATRAVDPTDGSCNSCHRNKTGTLSGTIAGATLTLSMQFAAGANGDPTPACSATLDGTASDVAARAMTVAYSGADSCEGPLANGTLAMTHAP